MENIDNIQKKILSINPRSNVYIGKYEVTNINEFNKQDNYFVFSGIGNHASFILMLKNEGLKIINHFQKMNIQIKAEYLEDVFKEIHKDFAKDAHKYILPIYPAKNLVEKLQKQISI